MISTRHRSTTVALLSVAITDTETTCTPESIRMASNTFLQKDEKASIMARHANARPAMRISGQEKVEDSHGKVMHSLDRKSGMIASPSRAFKGKGRDYNDVNESFLLSARSQTGRHVCPDIQTDGGNEDKENCMPLRSENSTTSPDLGKYASRRTPIRLTFSPSQKNATGENSPSRKFGKDFNDFLSRKRHILSNLQPETNMSPITSRLMTGYRTSPSKRTQFLRFDSKKQNKSLSPESFRQTCSSVDKSNIEAITPLWAETASDSADWDSGIGTSAPLDLSLPWRKRAESISTPLRGVRTKRQLEPELELDSGVVSTEKEKPREPKNTCKNRRRKLLTSTPKVDSKTNIEKDSIHLIPLNRLLELQGKGDASKIVAGSEILAETRVHGGSLGNGECRLNDVPEESQGCVLRSCPPDGLSVSPVMRNALPETVEHHEGADMKKYSRPSSPREPHVTSESDSGRVASPTPCPPATKIGSSETGEGQEAWPHGRQLYSSCLTEHAQWPQTSSYYTPGIRHGASGAANDSSGLAVADTDLAQQIPAALPNKSSAAGISGSTFSVENLLKTDKKPTKGPGCTETAYAGSAFDSRGHGFERLYDRPLPSPLPLMPVHYSWPAYKPPHNLLTLTTDPPFVTPNLQGYQTQFSPAALPPSHSMPAMGNSCFLPERPSQIQLTSEQQGHVIASSGMPSPCTPPLTSVENHQQHRLSSAAAPGDPENAAVRTSRPSSSAVLLESEGHADGEKSEGRDEDGEENDAKGQDMTMKIENEKTTQNSSLLKPDAALDHLSHVISTYAPNVNLCPSLVKTVSSVNKDGFVGVINSGLGIVNPNYTRSFIPPSDMPGSFQCSVCNKVMKSKRMYNRHRRNHLPVKHFLCVFCYKGFNDSFDLKRHTRTHTGNKPYACPITPCAKTCAQRVTLENHLEKIHGIKTPYEKKERRPKVYVCELCQTTYHTRHEVVEHTKVTHPNDPCLQRLHDRRHFGAEEGSSSSENHPKSRRRTGRQRK